MQNKETDMLASISKQILDEMGEQRKQHPPFIKWHEAYAFIKREVRCFCDAAVKNEDVISAEIVMCPNCSEFHQGFLNKCPFCLFPNFYSQQDREKELETMQSAFTEMNTMLTKIAALGLLAISECSSIQKNWGEVFDHLFAIIGEVEYPEGDLTDYNIKTVFDGYILENFNGFWTSIKNNEDSSAGDGVKIKHLYLTAAHCFGLISHLDHNLKQLEVALSTNKRRMVQL